jgi:hypothetical protein
LSGQLRLWQEEADRGLPQIVDSAEWLEHRFATLAALRRLDIGRLEAYPEHWRERLARIGAERLPVPRFLELLDCNALIEETFRLLPGEPKRRGEISVVIERLGEMIEAREAKLTS